MVPTGIYLRGGKMKALFLLLSLACSETTDAEPSSDPIKSLPSVPTDLSCETDDQCEIYGFQGEDCCGEICETTTVTTKAYATEHRAWREVYCTGDLRCPMAKCAGPQPWRFNYKAVCLNKGCVREDTFKDLPDQAALQFLCQASFELPSDFNTRNYEDKEQLILKQTSEQAKTDGVESWSILVTQISRAGWDIRKKWLEAGLKAYKIESCAVLSTMP